MPKSAVVAAIHLRSNPRLRRRFASAEFWHSTGLTIQGFGYDASGRLAEVTSGTQTLEQYGYDTLDRLVGISRNSGSFTDELVYDALGRRRYHTNNAGAQDYYFGGGVEWHDGVPRRLIQAGSVVAEITSSETQALFQDGSRNVTAVSSGTAVTYRRAYQTFGAILPPNASLPLRRGYAGLVNDASTGSLLYTQARHYYPRLGRFLQRDPLGIESDQFYAYGANNPYRFHDPLGLGPKSVSNNWWYSPSSSAAPYQYPLSIPVSPDSGIVSGGLYIANPRVLVAGYGDNRSASPSATEEQYRVYFAANFETGEGFIRPNPSCIIAIAGEGGCSPPLPFNTPGSPNRFVVNPTENGFLLGIHAYNSQIGHENIGAIDAYFFVQANGAIPASGAAILEPFPSAQLHQFQSHSVNQLVDFRENPLGPDSLSIPNIGLNIGPLDFSPQTRIVPFTIRPLK